MLPHRAPGQKEVLASQHRGLNAPQEASASCRQALLARGSRRLRRPRDFLRQGSPVGKCPWRRAASDSRLSPVGQHRCCWPQGIVGHQLLPASPGSTASSAMFGSFWTDCHSERDCCHCWDLQHWGKDPFAKRAPRGCKAWTLQGGTAAAAALWHAAVVGDGVAVGEGVEFVACKALANKAVCAIASRAVGWAVSECGVPSQFSEAVGPSEAQRVESHAAGVLQPGVGVWRPREKYRQCLERVVLTLNRELLPVVV
mmetsp:Transcript_73422/g.118469  ORF Transcript_73422/g.118469 Transcript_73422/m.118469 type:complete len:256 (+) Transcript_73422:2492-3259(+)